MEEKNEYFLVSGKILFKNKEDKTGEVYVNSFIALPDKNINSKAVSGSQEILKNSFENNTDGTLEVIDIFLFGFSYLGSMTASEFIGEEINENNPFKH